MCVIVLFVLVFLIKSPLQSAKKNPKLCTETIHKQPQTQRLLTRITKHANAICHNQTKTETTMCSTHRPVVVGSVCRVWPDMLVRTPVSIWNVGITNGVIKEPLFGAGARQGGIGRVCGTYTREHMDGRNTQRCAKGTAAWWRGTVCRV
jgi:hypothetical protein